MKEVVYEDGSSNSRPQAIQDLDERADNLRRLATVASNKYNNVNAPLVVQVIASKSRFLSLPHVPLEFIRNMINKYAV